MVDVLCLLHVVYYNRYMADYMVPYHEVHANQMKCWLLRRRGKSGVLGEKPLGAEKRTNKLCPLMRPSAGSDPGTHWWKANALTKCCANSAPHKLLFFPRLKSSRFQIKHFILKK